MAALGLKRWRSTQAWLRLVVGLCVGLGAIAGCSKGEEAAPAAAATVPRPATPEPPPPPPHPTTEDGVLQAFTQALELQDLPSLRRVIAPELAAELSRMHDTNPAEFWRRGGVWVENAKTGLTIATHADDAFKVPRWRALVRFGNGLEETVEFTLVEGKLLLAEP